MTEMRRVRLINWHNFANDTLDFQQITYLIGVNAVGKTTILDAIRYCLTTSKQFNSLGNRRSGRTLQGSVHGKQRGENNYARKGHTVSYIGIEFWDAAKRTTFVVTVRVESESPEEELRHVQQTWYLSPEGCTLEMLPFLDLATNQPASREQFRLAKGKMPPIDRQNDARDKICRRLGVGAADSVLGRKFGAVFPMGTSLDEIPDFRNFIYSYILPQPEIDLEALQKDEQELERLEEVLAEAQHRAAQLKSITEAGAAALAKQKDVEINEGFVLLADHRAKSEKEEEILLGLRRCNEEIERLEQRLAGEEAATDRAHDAYVKACTSSRESDESKALEALREQAAVKKAEMRAALKNFQKYQGAVAQIEALPPRAQGCGIAFDPQLLPQSIAASPERRHGELRAKLAKRVGEIDAELEQQYHGLWQAVQLAQAQRGELAAKIRTLESGQWVYPDNDRAKTVRDAVNQALAGQGMEPDAKILCELLYMNDASWQDCVEACLGWRRFDILVSSAHYGAAKHAYEQLGEAVGQVSLLDSRALERDRKQVQNREDALAGKVSSENPLAVAYVADLLGNITCCDASATLENHRHSVTRDLLRHYPYRLARMAKPRCFIGQDARREQLKAAQEEFRALKAHGEQEQARRDAVKEVYDAFQAVLHGTALQDLADHWGSGAVYDSCWQACDRLENEIRQWEESPILRSMLRQVQLAEETWKTCQAAQTATSGEILLATEKAARYQEEQEKAVDEAAQAKTAWEAFGEDKPFLQADVEKKYQDADRRKTPGEIAENQRIYQRRVESARDEFVNNQLIPLQQQYNQRYTCDFPLGLEGIDLFRAPYEQLVHIDLERYAASLQSAKERCKERFRQDILFRMKDDIAGARRQFHELDKIMQDLQYGEERYQFKIGASKDAQLGAFYRLIMNQSNQQVPEEDTLDALAAERNEAYEAQVNDLMEHIMQDLKQAAEEKRQGRKTTATELSTYVDYRHYLDYDIEITNMATKDTTPLSSVSQDSSGGENQAPFYIAICASLLQIYLKCDNGIRLILLDEAFSKMTSDRIRPMMEMFRQMQLQVLMITTVEKASAIYPYCDVTYSIIKDGMRNAIAPFYLEEDGADGLRPRRDAPAAGQI